MKLIVLQKLACHFLQKVGIDRFPVPLQVVRAGSNPGFCIDLIHDARIAQYWMFEQCFAQSTVPVILASVVIAKQSAAIATSGI